MTPSQHAMAVRADLYGSFAALFSEPLDAATIQLCREHGRLLPLAALPDTRSTRRALGRAVQVLLDAPDVEAAASRLNRDFGALFLGIGGPGRVVPACESAYPDGGAAHSAAAAEIEVMLQAHGLAMTDRCVDPPDHVAIELALMESLLERSDATSWADAALLLQGHLLCWVPDFAATCAARDPTGFYAAVAALLLGFLRHEHTVLADIANQPVAALAH